MPWESVDFARQSRQRFSLGRLACTPAPGEVSVFQRKRLGAARSASEVFAGCFFSEPASLDSLGSAGGLRRLASWLPVFHIACRTRGLYIMPYRSIVTSKARPVLWYLSRGGSFFLSEDRLMLALASPATAFARHFIGCAIPARVIIFLSALTAAPRTGQVVWIFVVIFVAHPSSSITALSAVMRTAAGRIDNPLFFVHLACLAGSFEKPISHFLKSPHA